MCGTSEYPLVVTETERLSPAPTTLCHPSSSLHSWQQGQPHSSCLIPIYSHQHPIYTHQHSRGDAPSLRTSPSPAKAYMKIAIKLFGSRPTWKKYLTNVTYLPSPYTSSDSSLCRVADVEIYPAVLCRRDEFGRETGQEERLPTDLSQASSSRLCLWHLLKIASLIFKPIEYDIRVRDNDG